MFNLLRLLEQHAHHDTNSEYKGGYREERINQCRFCYKQVGE